MMTPNHCFSMIWTQEAGQGPRGSSGDHYICARGTTGLSQIIEKRFSVIWKHETGKGTRGSKIQDKALAEAAGHTK